MKKIAFIPARYAATRFPGKLMQKIGDQTIISMVYNNARKMNLFDDVIVVTDSDIIAEEIDRIGGKFIKSKHEHQSGSDRIAEACKDMQVDIVVNIQGDEPFIKKQPLEDLVKSFEDGNVGVASLMQKFPENESHENSNIVKVVCNRFNDALYFSRSVIPYKRNKDAEEILYRHIGVYAYRKEVLLQFTTWPMGMLEKMEMLEQLRYLENGILIRMIETNEASVGIDTPEDLKKAIAFYNKD
ncbi:MAG: 3-deoxy-manno-octulosonate cytidylyltransferase [Bacteroidota bacterium]|nr:3-deoxy-manno-octulosonate cytidylyltransferase [Chitinophagaceae bacterium]MCE2758709.1 3-deoxy-manno-octulosonate cytidylyltransferase [Chitinophagaceae bacterium]